VSDKPKAVKAPKGKRKPYDQDRVLKLWECGKSISEIAAEMKPISTVYVHRVLTTKFPKQYERFGD
jgi:hypothetical protein